MQKQAERQSENIFGIQYTVFCVNYEYLTLCSIAVMFPIVLVCRMKNNVNINSKTITVDDFRGICIRPVISKVFEHCVLERYSM